MTFFKILFLLFFIWALGFFYFLIDISYSQDKLSENADAIIVLTGAKGRIDSGLELLHQKYAPKLLISGVGQKAALEDLSQYLERFPPSQMKKLKSDITLGHFANTTEENAIESFEWIKKNNFKKIILVTSNYHLPRSLYLFKRLMPDIIITPYKGSSSFDFKVIFIEYNKFLLAFFR